jgi:hypothetical protein
VACGLMLRERRGYRTTDVHVRGKGGSVSAQIVDSAARDVGRFTEEAGPPGGKRTPGRDTTAGDEGRVA